MSKLGRLLLPAVAILSLAAVQAKADDRLKSHLMEYQHPQEATSQHRTVQRIIFNSVVFIKDNLGTTPFKNLTYLNDVGTYPDGGEPILSPGDLDRVWNDPQSPALMVLYGEIEPSGGGSAALVVHSRIFMGDLPSAGHVSLQKNLFEVTSKSDTTEYGRLADGHAYVLVYALILDAIRTGKSPDVIFALINASTVIHDKLKTKLLLTPDLDEIYGSITAIGQTM